METITVFIFANLVGLALSVDPPPMKICTGFQGDVVIKPDFLGSEWQGWGTSLAWWANWAGGLNKTDRSKILNLVFDRKRGLGFNRVRYNIGGSPTSSNSNFLQMPAFKSSVSGPYNWKVDARQRIILLGAMKRGADTFEAFSNSPPFWMTNSNDSSGAALPYEENLPQSNHQLFADYLVDFIGAYKKRFNIVFSTLEPFNEPTGSHWVKGNKQEGCYFTESSMSNIIVMAKAKLLERGFSTMISGVDSLLKDARKIFNHLESDSLNAISQVNVHSYLRRKVISDISLEIISKLAAAKIAQQLGKTLVVSESGPFQFQGSEFDVALMLVRTIMMDLNVLKASAWNYWQAVDDFETEPYWGLIHSKLAYSEPFSYRLRPQFYAMKHFSHWVPKGCYLIKVPVGCSHSLTSAYDPMNKRLVVVIANYMWNSSSISLSLQQFRSIPRESSTIFQLRTTANYNYKKMDMGIWNFPFSFRVILVSRSIVTLVVTNVIY